MLVRKDAPKEGAPHRVPYIYQLSDATRHGIEFRYCPSSLSLVAGPLVAGDVGAFWPDTEKTAEAATTITLVEPSDVPSDCLLKAALREILTNFESGKEPTIFEIANKVGAEARHLERFMAEVGIQAKSYHRQGLEARRYTFDQRDQIEALMQEILQDSTPAPLYRNADYLWLKT